MSYRAAEFINDIENSCNDYAVPEVDPADLPYCDPESDGDQLRMLAERAARAFSDRKDLLAVTQTLLANAEAVHSFGLKDGVPPLTAVAFHDAMEHAHAALAKAEGKS